MIKALNMSRVVFHGCQLGLVSVRNGGPIKKPWAFETTIPEIVEFLAPLRCQGDHIHLYTWQMTDKKHECFEECMHNLNVSAIDVAAIEHIPIVRKKPIDLADDFSVQAASMPDCNALLQVASQPQELRLASASRKTLMNIRIY